MNILRIALALVLTQTGTITRPVRLPAATGEFTSVTLLNTHARRFVDTSRPIPPGASNECLLESKTPGVIWKIVLHGLSMNAGEIGVTDDKGVAYVHVCWSSAGGVYQLDAAGNRTGGGPQTEFLAAGAESTTSLTLRLGSVTAVVHVGPQPRHEVELK